MAPSRSNAPLKYPGSLPWFDVNRPKLPVMFGPNITGEFGYNRADGDEYRYAIGAFSTRNLGQGYTGNLNVSGFAWTFSASDSSEAYGNSSTVQPPALRVLPLIKT